LVSLAEPRVMGILNVTPDSFYAGSRTESADALRERLSRWQQAGLEMIDVGACSTRPGGQTVSEAEEIRRLALALPLIREEFPGFTVSVDTFRPAVARQAVREWGAHIINDISGLGRRFPEGTEPPAEEMLGVVAELNVPYVLTSWDAGVESMLVHWAEDVEHLRSKGVKDIILDPGFGFGKSLEDNYRILREAERLLIPGLPLLAGVSRKRMVWQVLDSTPDEALVGTTALHAVLLEKGVSILRVHDVEAALQTIKIIQQLR